MTLQRADQRRQTIAQTIKLLRKAAIYGRLVKLRVRQGDQFPTQDSKGVPVAPRIKYLG